MSAEAETGIDGPATPVAQELAPADRWARAGFGKVDRSSIRNIEIIPSEEELDEQARFRKRLREYHEAKEAVTEARLEVTLDKSGILGIEDRLDEFTEPERWSYMTEEERVAQKQARHEQLMGTINAIASLPEHLAFEPGITLIVGDNGLGKSTFAKALLYSARIDEETRRPGLSTDSRNLTYEEAREWVLHPRPGSDDVTELYQAGLAPFIAEHIRVARLEHGAPGFRYYDIASEFGSRNRMDVEMGRRDFRYDDRGQAITREASHDRRGRSHRQTVDEMLRQTIERDKREKEGDAVREKSDFTKQHDKEFGRLPGFGSPQVMAIDEPETGLSVKRHLGLVEYLSDLVPEGSAVIVPTNSVVLYQSDLPRIDLEHPERGIHRPSEYAA